VSSLQPAYFKQIQPPVLASVQLAYLTQAQPTILDTAGLPNTGTSGSPHADTALLSSLQQAYREVQPPVLTTVQLAYFTKVQTPVLVLTHVQPPLSMLQLAEVTRVEPPVLSTARTSHKYCTQPSVLTLS
jgi:hypothetical protein